MKKSRSDKERQEENTVAKAGRRAFLGSVGTIAVAVLSVSTPDGKKSRGPREIPLHEADFYAPHNDAG